MFRSSTVFVMLAAAAISAHAGTMRYDGRDSGAGPSDPRPIATQARDDFLAAIGGSPYTLTFEGVPIGYAASLNFTTFRFDQIGTDPTIFGGDDTGVTQSTQNSTIGFNTTPGGNTFLRFAPTFDVGTAGARLTFNTPINYFGAFFSGLGTAAGTLNAKFNDGSEQLLPITGGSGGGVQFFGFTSDSSFTTLDLVLQGVTGDTRDVYAIDDVITALRPTFVEVPEPSALALVVGALGLMTASRRRAKGAP